MQRLEVLQVRTGHTKAISLLHRLHIIHIVVSKKCPALKQETQKQAIQQQVPKIFLVACMYFTDYCFQTFNKPNHPFTIPRAP